MALPVSSALASDPTPEAAFAKLNAWRALAGIPPVATLDPVMNEGCRLHNAYLAANSDIRGLSMHGETPGRPGYTELGEQAGGKSVLSFPGGGPRIWEDTVYHRMSLLNPRLTTTWFDASSFRSCMGTSELSDVPTAQLTLYPWPANGTQDVPLAFLAHEYPSPYEDVPGVKQLGFLLTVNVNGPWSQQDSVEGSFVQAVSLTPDGGAPVAATGVDRRSPNGGYLDDGFAIYPHRPLQPGRWYTASATGYVSVDMDDSDPVMARHPFDITWRFRAVQADAYSGVQLKPDTLEFSSANPTPATVTVTRAHTGEQVARRTMRPGQRWRTRLPVGEYRVCWSQTETDTVKAVDRCRTWSRMTVTGKLFKGRARLSIAVPPSGLPRSVRLSVDVNDPTCCLRKGRHEGTLVRSSKTLTLKNIDPAVKEIFVRARTLKQRVNGERFGVAYATVRLRRR